MEHLVVGDHAENGRLLPGAGSQEVVARIEAPAAAETRFRSQTFLRRVTTETVKYNLYWFR